MISYWLSKIQRTIKVISRMKKFKNLPHRISSFITYVRQYRISEEAYLHPDAPLSRIANHSNFIDYISRHGNIEGKKVLEIGSRVVTTASYREYFYNAEYVGFDYYEGENVDVTGDAHRLSSYFKPEEKFDVIFSLNVFEHLAMPWLLPIEISKLLKVGGIVFIGTHFSHSSHERPWHFYQYSDMGLRALFNAKLGFECIEAGFSNPIIGRFSNLADEYLRRKPVTGLYCHSNYLGKKTKDIDINDFDWNKLKLNDVVGDTTYPELNSKPKMM